MIKLESYSETSDKAGFLKRFGEVPGDLYPERPLPPAGYWPYLIAQFPEVEAQFFIASYEGRDIGRIGCNLSKGHPGAGFFGFFEIDLAHTSAAKELVKAAEAWLKENGAKEVIGPIDFNVWLGNRFRVSGQEEVFSWEPNAPTQYAPLIEELGYQASQSYISMIYDDSVVSFERTKSAFETALKEGFTFRNLSLENPGEIDTLYALNVESFKHNYMYEPISQEQYESLHIKAVKALDLRYSFFIMGPDGEKAGYVFSFVEKDHLIVKSMLMSPKFQGARLASALLHASLKAGRENGFKRTVGAMVRKGNVSEHFFDHLQKPVSKNEYVMLKRSI